MLRNWPKSCTIWKREKKTQHKSLLCEKLNFPPQPKSEHTHRDRGTVVTAKTEQQNIFYIRWLVGVILLLSQSIFLFYEKLSFWQEKNLSVVRGGRRADRLTLHTHTKRLFLACNFGWKLVRSATSEQVRKLWKEFFFLEAALMNKTKNENNYIYENTDTVSSQTVSNISLLHREIKSENTFCVSLIILRLERPRMFAACLSRWSKATMCREDWYYRISSLSLTLRRCLFPSDNVFNSTIC